LSAAFEVDPETGSRHKIDVKAADTLVRPTRIGRVVLANDRRLTTDD
jgi:hypothetical protein